MKRNVMLIVAVVVFGVVCYTAGQSDARLSSVTCRVIFSDTPTTWEAQVWNILSASPSATITADKSSIEGRVVKEAAEILRQACEE